MKGDTPRSPSPTPAEDKEDTDLTKLREEREVITERLRQLDEENAELDHLLAEVEKGGEKIDKDLQDVPRDKDVDQAIQERENIKWLADVHKARADGAPILGKPESGLAYPGYREEKPRQGGPWKGHQPGP